MSLNVFPTKDVLACNDRAVMTVLSVTWNRSLVRQFPNLLWVVLADGGELMVPGDLRWRRIQKTTTGSVDPWYDE
jgi:hypothetical protein